MTARETLEYLYNIGMTQHYMKPITLFKNLQPIPHYKIDYDSISNTTDILPPSVWFTIDQNECLSKIRNDVEKSRVTREGYLMTNVMGNCLNQINYQSFEEDIGTIQENEHCFCVPFSVAKDNSEQFLKQITSELRIFHTSILNKVRRTYNNSAFLDEISRFIYSKFRTFLIFDAKLHNARLPIIESFYYPNVQFSIEKIKTKENPKFSPNEAFQQIKEGGLKNTFGYLSLDSKRRLLVMKKDEPDLDFSRQCFIGVWISSFLPQKRTEKKFCRDDAIWSALYQFYTNTDLVNRMRLTDKNKGFLVYFPPSSPTKLKRLPQFYLFEPSNKTSSPKWCFVSKSEVLTDWKKNLEVKFDFQNNTIMEEREYSQFSQNTPNEERGIKTEQPRNSGPIIGAKDALSDIYLPNGSISSADDSKETIQKLKKELEYYKRRCEELQTMNQLLLQQQKSSMIGPMHFPQFSQPYYHPPPPSYPYPVGYPPQYYPGPFSQSQVSASLSGSQVNIPPSQAKQTIKREQPPPKRQEARTFQKEAPSPKHAFEPVQQEQMTFGSKGKSISHQDNTMFMKKKSSTLSEEKDILKSNSESIRQIFVKPDARNISFQDSFAEYNQDQASDEDQAEHHDYGAEQDQQQEVQQRQAPQPKFDVSDRMKRHKSMQDDFGTQKYESGKKKIEEVSENEFLGNMRSPEFRRYDSLQEEQKPQAKETKPTRASNIDDLMQKYKQREQRNDPPQLPQTLHKDSDEDERIAQIKQAYQSKPEPVAKPPVVTTTKHSRVEQSDKDSDSDEEDAYFRDIKRKYMK